MIPVVVPSADRATSVLTNIEGQILCVPEGQERRYAQHNRCEIITHPPLKNLAAKRQWIYERFGDVFMVDDDIDYVSRVYRTGNTRQTYLTPGEIREVIEHAYDVCQQAGIYLFGFSAFPGPEQYKTFKPFFLSGYINASAFGLRKSDKLYFTENTTAAESHWINLLNAYHYRRCFQDRRFHFHQERGSTFFRPGGQSAKRTLESEKRDTLFLRKMFGECVRLKADKKHGKLTHRYQRTIDTGL